MTTINLDLNKYNAGYSVLPYIVSSDNINNNKFNYNINICWNEKDIDDMSSIAIGSQLYTECAIFDHGYKKGDKLFIYTGQQDKIGYYSVVDVINDDNIIIDFVLPTPYNSGSKCARYFKYKMPANPNGRCEIDFMDTLKDFVSSKIIDTNNIIDASSTKFEFFIVNAEEYSYKFNFTDNIFDGGNVSFINPSISSLTGVGIQIGDTITIQQDLYMVGYSTITDNGGFAQFNVTSHSLLVGDIITIEGQPVLTEYNRNANVTGITSTSITTDIPFTSGSIITGSIFAAIPNEYNTTTTVLDVYIDLTYGLVIKTNLGFARSTAPISGNIRLANNLTNIYVTEISEKKYVYDVRLDRLEYRRFNGYSPNIMSNNFILTNPGKQKICTIINNNDGKGNYNLIELNSKSFLKAYKDDDTFSMGMLYKFYTTEQNYINDVLLGSCKLNDTTDKNDLYFPIGIESLISNTNTIYLSGFDLELNKNNIKYYTVEIINTTDDSIISDKIIYTINNQCNGLLPIYSVVWKDAFGSWISYPFRMVSKLKTNINKRNTYYKREGQFNDNSFTLNTIDRGNTNYYNESNNDLTLTTGWVNDYANYLIEDLLKSTEVYIQTPDNISINSTLGEYLISTTDEYIITNTGEYILVGSDEFIEYIKSEGYLLPVVLLNNDVEYGDEFIDSLFNYKLTYKFAFNDYRF